ncbi:5-formyltetrahydrofolate cyclo-ligase [Candidatus Nitrosocosmicus franklandus]|uniref:5-formyltetrahydrofolate cyclo-ligase family protein (Modular protein) n=1 Tax=Candidatus Nitrosocosmicus franklandianus TaxID=1798806 RepID=A0A484I6I9_9ARCH|nr:5-formyltetrahydrofolate cyclo-ligase [Candidatus Nitrosocosmicus franklandus]VFJ12733.1 5-formyltetrahydrofolate cyclo-ligase family protein (modular protein) [Candidatus Nitrosocosmicus franklandus]
MIDDRDIMVTDRTRLRLKYLEVRKALSSFDSFIRSWAIQARLITSNLFCKAKVIGLYYPILNEVQTFRIITYSLSHFKTICLPAVVDGRLLFYKYESIMGLQKGKYNIMEPIYDNIYMNHELDLLIIPGIVFDFFGNRIGYGKGYYDKLISSLDRKKCTIAGLGYNFQVHPQEIEYFDHDAKLDALFTEAETRFFRPGLEET